jgi:hypothetical protein
LSELDDDVLPQRVVLDKVVELGREHRLDKVLAIGEDDTDASALVKPSGQDTRAPIPTERGQTG